MTRRRAGAGGRGTCLRHRRRGFALAMVITLSIALLGLIGVLSFNNRSQRATLAMLHDQARALAAAQGMMRLAVAKFRALRSEFYHLETLPAARKADFLRAWLADFDAGAATSPARILRDRLGCDDVGVASFTRLVLVETGTEYHRDILKIVAFGVASGQRRTIEEMIELRSTAP